MDALRENRKPSARKIHRIEGEFPMRRGGVLVEPQVAYETWGRLNAARDNGVLIFTGLSPSAHATSSREDPAPGWWEEMVGPDRPVDTERYFVVCVNSLGSCYGSTGAASIDPVTGEPYRLNFPVLSLEDVARGGHAVVEHLGIERLHTVIGCSMGGMTALAYCLQHPGAARHLVSISSCDRALPFSIALRSLQREMIRKDPDWNNGNYELGKGPITGMQLARKLGMITYRSAKEWEQRFGRERVSEEHLSGDPFCIDFSVESYLENHARKFTGQFDANCYLYLSRASDLFDLGDHGGSRTAAFSRIELERAMVIGVETDFLFPIRQQEELANGLRKPGRQVEFVRLHSLQGHDSFLVDMDSFRPVICRFFETCT